MLRKIVTNLWPNKFHDKLKSELETNKSGKIKKLNIKCIQMNTNWISTQYAAIIQHTDSKMQCEICTH